MDYEEKFNTEILEMMNELGKLNLLRSSASKEFSFVVLPNDLPITDTASSQRAFSIAREKRKVLLKLADLVVLKARHDTESIEEEELTFLIEINEKQFTEFYETIKSKILPERKDGKTHLFLDNDGNFWIEPKSILCYAMGAKSDRFKIVRYLVENTGYQNTHSISISLGTKDEQAVRKEIGKIKDNISKYLKIDGNEVIESKKDSGYRIGTTYKIVKL